MSVPVSNSRALDAAYLEELRVKEEEAENALVATIHARQVSEHLMLPSIIELTKDSLAEGNAPVVFVNFKESLRQLEHEFPDAALVAGGQTGADRDEFLSRFQARLAPVCLVMIQAGGTGLDGLQDMEGDKPRESFIVPGWSAKDLRQALGRLPRANTKSFVRQRLLFAADTLGTRVRKKINMKLKHIDTLNDGDLTL